jgi:hypothetical protein
MDTLHTMLRGLSRERKSQPVRITTFRTLIAQLEQAARPVARRPSAGKRVRVGTKRSRKS